MREFILVISIVLIVIFSGIVLNHCTIKAMVDQENIPIIEIHRVNNHDLWYLKRSHNRRAFAVIHSPDCECSR